MYLDIGPNVCMSVQVLRYWFESLDIGQGVQMIVDVTRSPDISSGIWKLIPVSRYCFMCVDVGSVSHSPQIPHLRLLPALAK